MKQVVTIVDYGLGNLFSVRRALEAAGATDIRTSVRPEDLYEADKIILPGVGAFEEGISGLASRGFIEPIISLARSGKPLLGICLGMQLLATNSLEYGVHPGLSLIPGSVDMIPSKDPSGAPIKVPFIGWAQLQLKSPAAGSCLTETSGEAVYLVHSFHFTPDSESDLAGTYNYSGVDITAAVRRENITGVQFHPEKSGPVGIAILKNFINS